MLYALLRVLGGTLFFVAMAATVGIPAGKSSKTNTRVSLASVEGGQLRGLAIVPQAINPGPLVWTPDAQYLFFAMGGEGTDLLRATPEGGEMIRRMMWRRTWRTAPAVPCRHSGRHGRVGPGLVAR